MPIAQGDIQGHLANNALVWPQSASPNLCPVLLPTAASTPSRGDVRLQQEFTREQFRPCKGSSAKTGIEPFPGWPQPPLTVCFLHLPIPSP